MAIFYVKFTFEMLTVRGQQHSFSMHERMFLWKLKAFEAENVSILGGTRTPVAWTVSFIKLNCQSSVLWK